jgi:hypothetical protein
MSITRHAAVLAATLLGVSAFGGAAAAAPFSTPQTDATRNGDAGLVQDVRHRGWRGVGIYIGPSYDYGYGYYPRRSYYYDDGYYYDRPYRSHRYGYRWTQERFKHPLGRR